ncbi:hypothetical protein [Antrihabitans cavernicola]|uniref:hypothetical protein n=1 Tax=Antrihabitans cavernicola TaxID=2495913 RepID=UPI001F344C0A|nr:hypothetical protein [Spelaeibacter cavernicola]
MSIFVLRCGEAPSPISLTSLPVTNTSASPDAVDVDALFAVLDADEKPRLIVLGDDAALAAVLTRLMRSERLHVEVAYVPAQKSAASRIYRTGVGAAAAAKALSGTATPTPLIRDDTGTALVGSATITGPAGGQLDGEAYVDDTKLFTGAAAAVHLEPTADMPGVRGYADRGRVLRPRRRWAAGRAVQLGSPAAVVTRDGVATARAVKRSTFYRHSDPWLVVG